MSYKKAIAATQYHIPEVELPQSSESMGLLAIRVNESGFVNGIVV